MTGSPVRGADCVASLKRWMARDTLGQSLATVIDEMKGGDDKNFSIKLKEPFPLLIDALAKVSSLAPFIMPERLANTDPYQQITEMVGSGPFKFVKGEFEPGHKVIYVKNTDYVPRNEPPNWASGGKVVKVDRVEWLVVPDATTKTAALQSGEDDWWENPPADLWPVLAANADVVLAPLDPLGGMGCLRFNQLFPPFDNVKMRQAVLMVANQADFMTAFVGDPKNWKICPSFFTCGTPMSNTEGSAALTGKRDFAAAKQLIAEAGYKGEKIILLDGVDQPLIHAEALVAADALKKLGLNVEIRSQRLGHRGDPPRLEKAAGRGWLEHVRNRLGRLRPARSLDQRHAAREWREGVVRLADRRQARGIADPMDQGQRFGRAPGYRCQDSAARL